MNSVDVEKTTNVVVGIEEACAAGSWNTKNGAIDIEVESKLMGELESELRLPSTANPLDDASKMFALWGDGRGPCTLPQ